MIGNEKENKGNIVQYEVQWGSKEIDFLSNHCVRDIPVVPGTCYMLMAGELIHTCFDKENKMQVELDDVKFSAFLSIDGNLKQKRIVSTLDKETNIVTISSVNEKGESIIHSTMKYSLVPYKERVIKVDEFIPEKAVKHECGKEFYDTLANNYQEEFAKLESVYQVDDQLYTKLEYDDHVDLISDLRKIAFMDVSTHASMISMSILDRMKGIYFESIGKIIFFPDFFKHQDLQQLSSVYVQSTLDLLNGVTTFLYDDQGLPMVQFIDSKGGVMEQKYPSTFYDEWIDVEEDVEIVSFDSHEWMVVDNTSVVDFHKSMDFENRRPLVVVSPEENDFTTYFRTVHAEYPTWDLVHVVCSEIEKLKKDKKLPKNIKEVLIEDGKYKRRVIKPITITPGLKAIEFDARGSIHNMKMVNAKRVKSIDEYEIEVQVQATGLNFRDVLNILGMYPGDPGYPGADFGGVVVRVGSKVDEFVVGDRVFGTSNGSIKTFTITYPHLIQKIPSELTVNEAASMPTLGTTVHESIVNLSKAKAGQTILIHAGTGGIGLMSVQYAKKIGLEIIATCGTLEKRKYLENLGVSKITSSRDPEVFKKDMEKWNVKVDIVINALSDNFIPYSANFLRDGGHFCEIGKRNIWSKDEMEKEYPNINYHIIALDTVSVMEPEKYRQVFQDFIKMDIEPMNLVVFPFERIWDAFETLRDAKHIGKVVIEQPPLFKVTDQFIVTGGLGYIGKHTAEMFFRNGALPQNIILVSSSRSMLPENWELEFHPTVEKCDISNPQEVRYLFQKYRNIKGVVHAAGILSDKTLPNLTEEDFSRVYKPKVQGAMNIDAMVQSNEKEKTWVVLCSSIASGMGAMGQANYSAANGALDKLARERSAEGYDYISIRWGAWVGGGMALDETIERSARMGLMGLEYQDGISILLSSIVDKNRIKETSPVITACPMEYSRLPPMMQYFDIVRTNKDSGSGVDTNELMKLQSEGERLKYIEDILLNVSKSLGIDDIDAQTPWREAGLDSLSMVEFRNILVSKFPDVAFSDTVLFDYTNMQSLTKYILSKMTMMGSGQTRKSRNTKIKQAKPVAIIGVSCRFPGHSNDPFEFFDFLMKGGDAMIEIPEDRFDYREYKDKMYVSKGGFIDDVWCFDNESFGISESEAEMMDPQQRITLECVQDAMLYCPNLNKEDCGVYVAACSNDFAILTAGSNESTFKSTGMANSIIANRVSYVLGMQGPSMTIDTACSSSLVALDTACKAINAEECKQAVVAGVNLNLTQHNFINFCTTRMLSPRGRCATFSDQADGYARSEGCGVVILKDLDQAKKDGDKIYAIVHGTSVNQDGRSANLTSPNGPSQERVIQTALDRAGLHPDDIDFIEAHGTGTALGDPQEIESISNVFSERTDKLPIGAAKSNVGHLEGAAGMVGLMKVIMSLQKGVLPPNINCDKVNPRIEPFLEKNIMLPTKEPLKLNPNKMSYYAGVSSFGFGGTNAHAIIGFHKPKEIEEKKE